MIIRPITPQEKANFDAVANHPTQSWAWGDFRRTTGNDIIRLGLFNGPQLLQAYTLTVHPIPGSIPGLKGKNILYAPRCPLPNKVALAGIKQQALEYNAIYAKLEPDYALSVDQTFDFTTGDLGEFKDPALRSGRPMFTQYNFWLDLTKSQDDLLTSFKSKWRYNIRLADKKGVQVQEDNSDQAFERYLELMNETTSRQGFYAHGPDYHRKMWQHMHKAGIAHLLTATYEGQIITTWILFKWKQRLFYPYGASTREHRNVMANHAMMWHAIQFGQTHGCTVFDLWGTAGKDPNPKDDWYGFHNFKEGFAPQMVKYVGTYDLITDPLRYPIVQNLDTVRRSGLKAIAKFKSAINWPTS